ncbi:thioredoxin-dependent thiol peroxidase [Acidipropionibacterium jensenii]|uniref:thioredoxin-dependent thiol peroxidase n=1 Tax=Acidipropionibacterium jensenii TaxID=1749 RepID=UPI00214C0B22|nr:thioredoxin-dependent thiol peroxidase [Acidipropionibacterium jensenii]
MPMRLTPGSIAPDFTLPDADGSPVTLSGFAGKRVIVYFYPAAMTPGCTVQAVDFSTHHEAIAAAGYTVLGISPDSQKRLQQFAAKESLSITLLSDADTAVMKAYGAYGLKNVYGKEIEGVIRSTFVVDVQEDGRAIIRVAQYNVRATGHVDKLCRELGI